CHYAARWALESSILSSDDKNKVNVGTLAVSRYIQIRKIFPTSDRPNYHDHDFPEPNSKLNPSGYLMLSSKDSSIPSSVKDENGRDHLFCPVTGNLHLYLRAVRFHPSTAINHANDLYTIMSRNIKPVVGVISDGGPDWCFKSMHNIFIYGRLWKDLNLDYFGITQHAPGNSKENPIEHAWAPLSRDLVGVTLRRRTEGMSEVQNFDHAITECLSYWKGGKYDDFMTDMTGVMGGSLPFPYNDFENIRSSFQSLRQDSEYADEFRFILNHCTRRCHGIEYMKCFSHDCSHCTANVIQATTFMQQIHKQGCMSFSPAPDPAFPGHYQTYLDMKTMTVYDKLDNFCPSNTLGSCGYGCRYVFLSNTDWERHMKFMHPIQRREEMKAKRNKSK
ncbi:uncharacterized protein LOC135482911, partial [Lineus longissimus]|uniref:uncharacterized protein LOC135482911 n=1 Tax=Lineus longissimus TaxID=88925 RepID=UPI00315DCF6B